MGIIEMPWLFQHQREEWLRSIFSLCDSQNRGWIDIQDLISLGFEQGIDGPEAQAVRDLLYLLDPLGDGCLTFEEFSMGVSSLMDTSSGSMTSFPRVQSTDSTPTVSDLMLGLGHINEPREKMSNTSPVYANGLSGENNVWKTTTKPESLNLQDEDNDSGLSKSTSPDSQLPGNNSQCSSMSEREVSFECYGEAVDEVDNAHTALSDLDISTNTRFGNSSLSTADLAQRNTWMRNSLRRNASSASDGLGKRWGSFRHPGKRVPGSALTSFTSSGRSCNGETEEVYSDVSLEEDVNDLNHKLQTLQQQVAAIADNRSNNDERYSRTKQENAALNVRIQMLEESLRDVELRAEQRLTDEQKRHRELIVRVERERQLEVENCTIRLQAAEKELQIAREEAARLRSQTERLRSERNALQDRLSDLETVFEETKLELRKLTELGRREREEYALERAAVKQSNADLNQEIEILRSLLNAAKPSISLARSPSVSENTPQATRVRELELEVKALRQDNKSLQEANEELQAQLLTHGLEEGRVLLTGTDNSLAAEFEAMGQEDVRKALREQQEVNAQLRSYIEGILLNIVENQPQLLERKQGEK